MQPTLCEGDFIVVVRYFRSLSVGDLVLVEHPVYDWIVKRIYLVSKAGQLLLEGECSESVTADQMGWVSKEHVIGKVYCCI